jgi:hypothetical protein
MNKSTIVLLQEQPKETKYAPWYELFRGTQQKETKKKDPMIIDITISLPKVTPKPKRKVRVFSNFVKVGFDQYSIKIDPFSGNEYVKINGVRYEILRDFFNRGVLVEI